MNKYNQYIAIIGKISINPTNEFAYEYSYLYLLTFIFILIDTYSHAHGHFKILSWGGVSAYRLVNQSICFIFNIVKHILSFIF